MRSNSFQNNVNYTLYMNIIWDWKVYMPKNTNPLTNQPTTLPINEHLLT